MGEELDSVRGDCTGGQLSEAVKEHADSVASFKRGLQFF